MAKVLVTGGAGFLGRGILRRVARGELDWDITCYSRDETKQDECHRKYPFARYVLGDVRNLDRLRMAMIGHDYVIHAAALKYIPEAELNAMECIEVNVHGAEAVIKAAQDSGVQKVVGISTDKACQPVNIYGCTKMLMERMFSEVLYRHPNSPSLVCVRYGNVVGSTGSVIPLFRRQVEESGRVRITDPRMTRFWMGVDEAIDLIVWALAQCRPGSIAIPTASAMKIIDVAKAATSDDVEIEIIGERPGEKTHEQLVHYEESVRAIRHSDPPYLELLPPGSQVGEAAFTLASHSPQHWMTIKEMRRLIADAEEV